MKTFKKAKKELIKDVDDSKNILTIPTFLNVARIVLTFVIIYMMVVDSDIVLIVFVFVIAALTDWFDGYVARKYNLVSDFGRKADMLSDRFLWVGTALAFIFFFGIRGMLEPLHGLEILLIMSREIIAAPFAIAGIFSTTVFPNARYIAKVTTVLQGFALPAVLLSVFYPVWTWFSLPLSIIIGFIGSIAGLHYVHDMERIKEDKYVGTGRRQNKTRQG